MKHSGSTRAEGHARDVHFEVVNTPFIISFPFRLEQGIKISHPTENVDVWPTVLDMVGLPMPEDSDGQSRLGWLIGDRVADAEIEGFAQLERSWGKPKEPSSMVVGVHAGDFRLIHDVNNPDLDRLYDLRSDEEEMRDVSEDFGGTLEDLRSRAVSYLEQNHSLAGGVARNRAG